MSSGPCRQTSATAPGSLEPSSTTSPTGASALERRPGSGRAPSARSRTGMTTVTSPHRGPGRRGMGEPAVDQPPGERINRPGRGSPASPVSRARRAPFSRVIAGFVGFAGQHFPQRCGPGPGEPHDPPRIAADQRPPPGKQPRPRVQEESSHGESAVDRDQRPGDAARRSPASHTSIAATSSGSSSRSIGCWAANASAPVEAVEPGALGEDRRVGRARGDRVGGDAGAAQLDRERADEPDDARPWRRSRRRAGQPAGRRGGGDGDEAARRAARAAQQRRDRRPGRRRITPRRSDLEHGAAPARPGSSQAGAPPAITPAHGDDRVEPADRSSASATAAAIAGRSRGVGDDRRSRTAARRGDHRLELGARSPMRVGQPRVVGGAVDGDDRPARRRRGAATVAAPIPRRGAGDERDAFAHVASTAAHGAPRGDDRARARRPPRRAARPPSAADARRVAEHAVRGSPPATPPARSVVDQLGERRRVAGARALERDRSGRERQHQRGLGAAGVGVAAHSAGDQARTSRPSARSRATAARERRGVAAVGVDEEDAVEASRSPSGRARPGPARSPPRRSRGCRRSPGARRSSRRAAAGRRTDVRRSAAARSASASAIAVSVPSGRWGPCCSVAPSGTSSDPAVAPGAGRRPRARSRRRAAARTHRRDRSNPSGISTSSGDELGDRGAAEAEQRRVDPGAEDLQHVRDAGLAVRGQAPEVGAADHHRAGAERERLDHVAAAAHAAVEHHLDLVADRLGDRPAASRIVAGRAVEVVAAVVGDRDRGDAGVDRAARVVDAGDALEHERPAPRARAARRGPPRSAAGSSSTRRRRRRRSALGARAPAMFGVVRSGRMPPTQVGGEPARPDAAPVGASAASPSRSSCSGIAGLPQSRPCEKRPVERRRSGPAAPARARPLEHAQRSARASRASRSGRTSAGWRRRPPRPACWRTS